MLGVSYPAVYRAWVRFRKGKRPSAAIDQFAYSLEQNLQGLSLQLTDQTYRHGSYQRVVLQEKKRRDLAVASVRDRVVHRLLYDYLVDCFDRSFDPDVWSCRKGKGLHACLKRTQKLLHNHKYSYIWRADIVKFFDHVDHRVLLDCLQRKISRDRKAMWLCEEVVANYAFNRQTTDDRRQTTDDRRQTTDRYSDWQSD